MPRSDPAASSTSASGAASIRGDLAEDVYEPKRFFSYLADDALLEVARGARFDVVDFHTLAVGIEPGSHFQALTLARRE